MLILGGDSNIGDVGHPRLLSTYASGLMFTEMEEMLDWVVIPRASAEFNYHHALAKGEVFLMYTRSASAMIRGLRKIQDLEPTARVFSAHEGCMGIVFGAFEYKAFVKTKVGGAIGVIGHNVKQFFVRSAIKGVAKTADLTYKARENLAEGDWDKAMTRLKRKKWFDKFKEKASNYLDHYSSLENIESCMNPFRKGFLVVVAHSDALPSKIEIGGFWRSISHKLKFNEIANTLQNLKAERGSVYQG